MDQTSQAYLLALTANIIFALSVQVFAHYSEKVSAAWMNWFKAVVAFICFTVTVLIIKDYSFIHPGNIISLLVISGILGLAIGDLCLLAALKDLGPGRTMVLVAFHPLITGVLSWHFHGEAMELYEISAVFFMIYLCSFQSPLTNYQSPVYPHRHMDLQMPEEPGNKGSVPENRIGGADSLVFGMLCKPCPEFFHQIRVWHHPSY